MKKTSILLLAGIALACSGNAQTTRSCGTDIMHQKYSEQNPRVAELDEQLEKNISSYIAHHNDLSRFSRKTADAHAWDDVYDIPVVVHIMHDYGPELLTDNAVYNLIEEMNRFYSMQQDVSSVIPPFKKYVGNPNFKFHLASKDPFGNPTKGITRRFSYLTYGGDDQVKMDQWNPSNYFNIWFENVIGLTIGTGTVLAYATFPSSGAVDPTSDGVICGYKYIKDGGTGGSTMDHETGHYLNLAHPWNSSGTACGDACGDDNVDDTPPTKGHPSTMPLYDTACASNYYKLYLNMAGDDSLVNFPDTANVQNTMDYSASTCMFTKGQVERMRGALNSDIGNRDSLWTPYNLALTGAMVPAPDLKPINDFAVKNNSGKENTYFTCPGNPLKFICQSWQDTVVQINWAFTNNASNPTATASVAVTSAINASSTVTNSFETPGWVKITLSSTGNNSGTTTTEFPRTVFVADKDPVQADGYFMDFTNADTAKWPMFNYYSNEFGWKIADVGMYDNKSIEFTGFDSRVSAQTGTALGDYDDFFSMPMDLTAFAGSPCNLNYFYSGASRTSNTYDMNDRMEISYSIDNAATWKLLGDTLKKGNIVNRGAVSTSFTPTSLYDWAPMSIAVPASARTAYTVFRFRYKPSLSVSVFDATINPRSGSRPTSNNFYMDRIHFSKMPAAVSNATLGAIDVAVVPNPTNGDAWVRINDAENTLAHVVVSDITGKQLFAINQQINSRQATIQIPKEVIAVKGIYMVQTTTGTQTKTQKLVVY